LSTIDGIRRAFPSFSGRVDQQPNCSRSEEEGGVTDVGSIALTSCHSSRGTPNASRARVRLKTRPKGSAPARYADAHWAVENQKTEEVVIRDTHRYDGLEQTEE